MLRTHPLMSGNRGYMKHIDLSLVEIEEIELKPVSIYPNQWVNKLQESVNGKGVETSFDNRVKIKEVIEFNHPTN